MTLTNRLITALMLFLLMGSFAAQAAPTFTVNSASDMVDANPGDGVCETAPGNGICSLRAAIMEANHTTGGGATIILPPGTYTLTIAASGGSNETNGDLNITSSMTIVGAGTNNTIIDGNGQSGVLSIFAGISLDINVVITGVTIRNGQNDFGGGGIFNGGILTIRNSTISGNSAPGDCDFTGRGGGIANGRTLTMINSTVSANNAGCDGGGIINWMDSTMTIFDSTVSGNSGGGISNIGALTMINSTVSGNSDGPGISNWPGISNNVGTTRVFNSTITQNSLGVFNFFSSAPFTFQNTILAGNVDDCAGTITSNGFNVMKSFDASRCTLTGGGVTLADPKLGPLQNNGGPTQTHALVDGSPALDAGDPGGCRDSSGALLTTDQRGFARHVDSNNDGAARCDIGAFEAKELFVVAAILPNSRSVQIDSPATAFATIINAGQALASGCTISPITDIPATLTYRTTDPATNQVIGAPNALVDIPAAAAQSFVFALTPTGAMAPTDVQFSFECTNANPAPIRTGVNTLLFSASATPVADIVALAATLNNDGIVNIPGTNGTGVFAVASINIGAGDILTVSADTGGAILPVNIFICQTDPQTSACFLSPESSVSTTILSNETPTFGLFVAAAGDVSFVPETNRIFVRFKDSNNVTRGLTSVAVRSQ